VITFFSLGELSLSMIGFDSCNFRKCILTTRFGCDGILSDNFLAICFKNNVLTRMRSLGCISPLIRVHRHADTHNDGHNVGQIDQSHNLL